MTSKAAARVLTQLFFILAVPLLLMIGAARLTLSHQFLRFEYSRSGFPADDYGFTTHDRMALGNFAIDYLFNGEDISYLAERRLPLDKCWQPPSAALDCPMFNATELRHMSDVKTLADLVFSIAAVLLVVASVFVVPAYRDRSYLRPVTHGVILGCVATLGLLAAALVSVTVAWDGMFDAFHELFFAAGTWRFPYSDTLIRLYPEQLFVDASILIALLMAVGAMILLVINSRVARLLP